MPSSLKGLARPETRLLVPELYRIPAPRVPLDGRVALRTLPRTVLRPPRPAPPVPAPPPLPLFRPPRKRKREPAASASSQRFSELPNSFRLPQTAGARTVYRVELLDRYPPRFLKDGIYSRIWLVAGTDSYGNPSWDWRVRFEAGACSGYWGETSLFGGLPTPHRIGVTPVNFVPCRPPSPPLLPDLPYTQEPEPRSVPYVPPWTTPGLPETTPAPPAEEEEEEPEEPAAPPPPLEPAELPRPAEQPAPPPPQPGPVPLPLPPLTEPRRRPEPAPQIQPKTRPRPALPRPDVPPPVPRPDPRPARQQPPPPQPEQPQRRRQSPPAVLTARVERIETGETSTSETLPDPRPNPPETQTGQCPELDLDCLKQWCGAAGQYLDYYVGKWERQGYVEEKRGTLIVVPTPLSPLVSYINDRLGDLKRELIEAIDLAAFVPAEALESWPKNSAQPYWLVYWGVRRMGRQSLKQLRIPGDADLTIPKPPEIYDGKIQLIVKWPGLTFPYTRIWVGQGSAEAIEGWLKSFKGEFEVRFQESPTRNFQTGRLVPTRRRHWNGSRWLPPQRWD